MRPEPAPTLGSCIAASLTRLRAERGGKSLAACFDGREGKEVAESTVSRWIADPGRFPAVFIPVLVEIDAPFRGQIFGMLAARAATPEAVMGRLSAGAAAEVAAAYHGLIAEEVAPGRWVRR